MKDAFVSFAHIQLVPLQPPRGSATSAITSIADLRNRVGECSSPLLAAQGACCVNNKFPYAPLHRKNVSEPKLKDAFVFTLRIMRLEEKFVNPCF